MKNPIFLKIALLFLVLFTASQSTLAQKQYDSSQTLRWAIAQAERVDTLLNDAIATSDQMDILLRLMDSYIAFEAVAVTGLYCTEARVAAEMGRDLCDVVNYRMEKDLVSAMRRAAEARHQAQRLKVAAGLCEAAHPDDALTSFSPNELIRTDAQLAELDLSDGLAVGDFHILAQKLEHAIRLLHDIEHVAGTLSNCTQSLRLAQSAIIQCRAALGAPNWTLVNEAVQKALKDVRALQQSACF
jgi:hypothetical protein